MTETEQLFLDQDFLLSQGKKIPLDAVRAWMNSASLEVQDRVFGLILQRYRLLEMPPLQETDDFCLHYLEVCLHDLGSNKLHIRHGWQAENRLRTWFNQLFWDAGPAAFPTLEKVRDWMARLSIAEDENVRRAILSVLTDLFSSQTVAEFFQDWSGDSALSPVYSEALTEAERQNQCWDQEALE